MNPDALIAWLNGFVGFCEQRRMLLVGFENKHEFGVRYSRDVSAFAGKRF